MADPNDHDTGEYDLCELERLATQASPGATRPSAVSVSVGALSHPGLVRENNEDHFIVGRLRRTADILCTNLPEPYLPPRLEESAYAMGVADGMGGAAAGEVASALALSLGTHLTLDARRWHMRLDEENVRSLADRVRQFFRDIDLEVTERARVEPNLTGMGTTLTVAYTVGLDGLIFHIGDSRAYLFRRGALRQLTRDETLAQAMADAGEIPIDSVSSHPMRHVLTRAIGAGTGMADAVMGQIRFESGDCLLMCTDGLTDMIDDSAIAEVLARTDDPQDACQGLVDAALAAGGRDNITVVIARYETRQSAVDGSQ